MGVPAKVDPIESWTFANSAVAVVELLRVFLLCKLSSHESVDLKRCRGGDGGGEGDRCATRSIEDERRLFLDEGRDGIQEGKWSSKEIFLLIFLWPFCGEWVSKLTMVRASSLQWLAESCLEDAMEVAVAEEILDAERPQCVDLEVFIAGRENVRERVSLKDGFLRCSRHWILSKRCMVKKNEGGGGRGGRGARV